MALQLLFELRDLRKEQYFLSLPEKCRSRTSLSVWSIYAVYLTKLQNVPGTFQRG